jgi:2-keto-4-pentenoate hydratase
MSDRTLREMAEELQHDLDTFSVRRLFKESRGPDSVAEAYQLQRALRQVREDRGEQVVGFKIGYTSPTLRRQSGARMGLSESVHGYLWAREAHPSGAEVDHRRLGIEGELAVTLLSINSGNIDRWEVAYEPIIELHAIGMDGPEQDDNGRRGLELIGTNCVHKGVVHSAEKKQARLGDVPLDAHMSVEVGGRHKEAVTLAELEVDGISGPVGTISWLLRTLKMEGQGEEDLIKVGTVLICSTPGGLYPVPPGAEVRVDFDGMTTTCVADIV